MMPIFAVPSYTAQTQPSVTGTKEASNVHPSKVKDQEAKPEKNDNPQKPLKDEYLPEEEHQPSDRYWIKKAENGKSEIYFDHPEKSNAPDHALKAKDAQKNRKNPEPEICRGNNDKVEREIKKLKEREKTLKQQIHAETDEENARKLEQELKQVENELRQKDNDRYRRQNTVFT